MNYADLLLAKQTSGIAALLKYILDSSQNNNIIPCFVEGQDFVYYRSRIEQLKPDERELHFYSCNGRFEVERVCQLFYRQFRPAIASQSLFLCDNDYGLMKQCDNVCYTEQYSIENYYANANFVSEVIRCVFNINRESDDFAICMEIYTEKKSIFDKLAIPVNAYYYTVRAKEIKQNIEHKRIGKKSLNSLINDSSFKNFSVKEPTFAALSQFFSDHCPITKTEYEKNKRLIGDSMRRGKWEIWFVSFYLEGIRNALINGELGLTKTSIPKVSFQNEIMTTMERYATTPASLIEYATRRLSGGNEVDDKTDEAISTTAPQTTKTPFAKGKIEKLLRKLKSHHN